MELDTPKMCTKEELDTEPKISGSKPVSMQECTLSDQYENQWDRSFFG